MDPLANAISDILREIVPKLWALRETGVLARRSVACNEWRPKAKECHANVEEWARLHTDHCGVDGWLAFDFMPVRFEFLSHAVIKQFDGKLIDITPPPSEAEGHAGLGPPCTYPFVRHPGSADEFARLVENGVARIRVQWVDGISRVSWHPS